jgi:hypothetical protein
LRRIVNSARRSTSRRRVANLPTRTLYEPIHAEKSRLVKFYSKDEVVLAESEIFNSPFLAN